MRFEIRKHLSQFLGLLALIAICFFYVSKQDTLFHQAKKMNLVGNVNLKFAKSSYNLSFKKLSSLDEAVVESEIKKIHQISEKISATSISNNGDLMITLVKTIDDSVALVVFKNQQIQMIQKVLKMSENKIEFQYGELVFNLEPQKIAYSQYVELEF